MEFLTPRSHESGDFYLKPYVSLPGFVWTGLKAMSIIISVARFPIAPTTYKNTMNMLSSDCVFLTVKCFNLGENEASH